MKKTQVQGVLSERLADKRKKEILFANANRPAKLAKHIMPTFDRETGQPDGGTRSALIGCGEVCQRCGMPKAAILELVEGKSCDAAAYKKLGMPLNAPDSDDSKAVTDVKMNMNVTTITRADVLAGIF